MHTLSTASLILAAAACTAQASITFNTCPLPGGYAQSACFPSNLPGLIPGGDLGAYSSQDFHEQPFAGASSATTSSTYSNGSNISNNATATAELGRIRMASFNSCPNSTLFAGGMSNACWKETFTVSHPSFNGQAGFMVFQIRARGSLAATGFAGSTSLLTTGYKNTSELMTNSYFNRGNSDAISTDRQRAQWAIATFGNPPSDSRTVDDVVTMAVPITFGQSFDLAVCARAATGQRSSSGVGGLSTATVNFAGPGVTWNGITGVFTSGGSPVSGASILSGSGTDWNPPTAVCDSIDFNGDGLFPDTSDIDDFLSVFSGGPCSTGTCGDIDFNNDGLFPDTLDIDALLSVFSGGACL